MLEARFGSETLAEVYERRGIALAITAVEMNRCHSWVFKTPHHPNTNGRDNPYRLADVCLATTAAPLFRSLAPLDDPHAGPSYFVFADGGLWIGTRTHPYDRYLLILIIEAFRPRFESPFIISMVSC